MKLLKIGGPKDAKVDCSSLQLAGINGEFECLLVLSQGNIMNPRAYNESNLATHHE